MRRLKKRDWHRQGGNRMIAIGILRMEILGCTMEVLARMIVWRNIQRRLCEWSRNRSNSKNSSRSRSRRRRMVGMEESRIWRWKEPITKLKEIWLWNVFQHRRPWLGMMM